MPTRARRTACCRAGGRAARPRRGRAGRRCATGGRKTGGPRRQGATGGRRGAGIVQRRSRGILPGFRLRRPVPFPVLSRELDRPGPGPAVLAGRVSFDSGTLLASARRSHAARPTERGVPARPMKGYVQVSEPVRAVDVLPRKKRNRRSSADAKLLPSCLSLEREETARGATGSRFFLRPLARPAAAGGEVLERELVPARTPCI